MPEILLTELLEQVPKEVEAIVEGTRHRFNNKVRDIIRNETGLRLPTDKRVEVKVKPGCPTSLRNLTIEVDGDPWLIPTLAGLGLELGRLPADLREVHRRVTDRYAEVGRTDQPLALQAMPKVAKFVEEYRDQLKLGPTLRQILGGGGSRINGVHDDILGVYYFPAHGPRRIELYWAVIGLIAGMKGISVVGLTIDVLAHELAHAYTHLGQDIDGQSWWDEDFSLCHDEVVEGLAQYYAFQVVERLGDAEGCRIAHNELLPSQPSPYRTHLDWIRHADREKVRKAMIAMRRNRLKTLEDFEESLQRGFTDHPLR